MPDLPQTGQLALLGAAALFFAAGTVAALRPARRGLSSALSASGVLAATAVLAWHSARRGSWVPLEDNFDALVWLALLLALFTLYVQTRRPIGGLDRVALPVVILLLACGGWFGTTRPHEYDIKSLWSWTHRVSSYGGFVAFAVAGAGGTMYLRARRRLRNKQLDVGGASLERLESVTYTAVTLGFALLSVGLVTGLVRVLDAGRTTALGREWFASPKVLLTCAVWVVYALILHAPLNPSFRGRRTALLSIVGLVLMVGTLMAVQLVPTTR